MFLGKVVGTVWSTKKSPDLEGIRFLVVHPYDLDKEPTRNIVVVADRLGAGTGEMVICAYGKAARTAIGNQDMSIEAAVVGIVEEQEQVAQADQRVGAVARAGQRIRAAVYVAHHVNPHADTLGRVQPVSCGVLVAGVRWERGSGGAGWSCSSSGALLPRLS